MIQPFAPGSASRLLMVCTGSSDAVRPTQCTHPQPGPCPPPRPLPTPAALARPAALACPTTIPRHTLNGAPLPEPADGGGESGAVSVRPAACCCGLQQKYGERDCGSMRRPLGPNRRQRQPPPSGNVSTNPQRLYGRDPQRPRCTRLREASVDSHGKSTWASAFESLRSISLMRMSLACETRTSGAL